MSHSPISSLLTKLGSSIVSVFFLFLQYCRLYRNILTVDRDVEQFPLHVVSDVDVRDNVTSLITGSGIKEGYGQILRVKVE